MDVSLIYFDGCSSYKTTLADLRSISEEINWGGSIKMVQVGSDKEAEKIGFRGSPTILVDGVDPFFDEKVAVGLACRLYLTEAGLRGTPSKSMLLDAMTRVKD